MNTENERPVDWAGILHKHCINCEGLTALLEQVEVTLNGDGSTVQQFAELKSILREITEEAESLHEALCVKPMRRMLSGERMKLTRQEYHILQSAGVSLPTAKQLGLSPVDDYEVYQQCIYEDDKMVAFMHPDETSEVEEDNSRPGTRVIRVRFALSPEECSLEHFRPDQKDFWIKHRPDVIARAGRMVTEPTPHAKAASSSCNSEEGQV